MYPVLRLRVPIHYYLPAWPTSPISPPSCGPASYMVVSSRAPSRLQHLQLARYWSELGPGAIAVRAAVDPPWGWHYAVLQCLQCGTATALQAKQSWLQDYKHTDSLAQATKDDWTPFLQGELLRFLQERFLARHKEGSALWIDGPDGRLALWERC